MSDLGKNSRLVKLKWLRENDAEWVKRVNENNSIAQRKQYKKGRINGFKGSKHSYEAKKIISDKWSEREIIACPHCKLESKNKANMIRWHFDNCKFKIS